VDHASRAGIFDIAYISLIMPILGPKSAKNAKNGPKIGPTGLWDRDRANWTPDSVSWGQNTGDRHIHVSPEVPDPEKTPACAIMV